MIFFPGKKFSRKGKQPIWREPGILEPTKDLEREPRFALTRRQMVFIAILIGLGVAVWFALASPIFAVKTIEISGEVKPETQQELEKIKGRNIFLLGGKRAEESLKKQQPSIKRIKIIRGLPDIVKIQIVERDPAIGWLAGDKHYLVDKEGFAYKEVAGNSPQLQNLLRIIDESGAPVAKDQPIVSAEFIEFVRTLAVELPHTVDLKAKEFKIKQSTFQIEVTTENGPRLLVETSRPLSVQLEALKLVYNERKDQIKEYVDVRVEGYVYYK